MVIIIVLLYVRSFHVFAFCTSGVKVFVFSFVCVYVCLCFAVVYSAGKNTHKKTFVLLYQHIYIKGRISTQVNYVA